MIGKLVRWERDGQWFTAKVHGTGVIRGSWAGEVVDPGNWGHPLREKALAVGEWLPNLHEEFLTEQVSDG